MCSPRPHLARLFCVIAAVSACNVLPTNQTPVAADRTAYTLTWVRPPSPIMPRRVPLTTPPTECVAVGVSASAGSIRAPGEPIPGIDVKLGKNPGSGSIVATTDNDGVAQFCGLTFEAAGAYVVTASIDDAETIISDPFFVPAREARLSWHVQPKATISGRSIVGAGGACPAVIVTAITGSAPDTPSRGHGDPVPGVVVKRGFSNGATLAPATTDQDGIVSFCDINITEPGVFALTAELEENNEQPNPVYSAPELATSSPFYNGPNRRVLSWTTQPTTKKAGDLYAQGCPAVTVRAATGFSDDPTRFKETSGEPQVGVDVEISFVPGGQNLTATTDASGVATFCGVPMPAGAFNLRAIADGSEPVLSLAVTIAP